MAIPQMPSAKWPPIETFKMDGTATANIATAGTTSEIIVICGYNLVADGSVAVKFQSGSTDLTGPFGMVAASQLSAFFLPGLFATAAGETAKINLGSAVQVSGFVNFWRFRA